MLGTSRTNPYNPKKDQSKTVLNHLEKHQIDFLVAIGGEDTLGVAHKLYLDGINAVGIPKTIDKDLSGTDYTLGFETAVNVITEEIDRLRTTAGSHRRIFVVETMGRHAGWLALEGGESSGAYIILIPEYDFDIAKVNELVSEGRKRGPVTISSLFEGKATGRANTKEERSIPLGIKRWVESGILAKEITRAALRQEVSF
jgi:6-phosphofructokinase 1